MFNPEIESKLMKVTAFILKTAKKNDLETKATIYFRVTERKTSRRQVSFPLAPIIEARKSRDIKTVWH